MKTSAQAIREGRIRMGWSQDDLAGAIGVTKAYISDLERGKRSPGPATYQGLCEALGIEGELPPPKYGAILDMVEVFVHSYPTFKDRLFDQIGSIIGA